MLFKAPIIFHVLLSFKLIMKQLLCLSLWNIRRVSGNMGGNSTDDPALTYFLLRLKLLEKTDKFITLFG